MISKNCNSKVPKPLNEMELLKKKANASSGRPATTEQKPIVPPPPAAPKTGAN